VQEQDAEQSALLRSAERDSAPVVVDLERTEYPKLHFLLSSAGLRP
jgi:hypothetical protein